jgi:predicted RNA binding protein YcfA (HicA-like mRNA interferase family)
MPKFPRLTGQQVIAALHKVGFEFLRVKGSHHFLSHSDGGARSYLSIRENPSGQD